MLKPATTSVGKFPFRVSATRLRLFGVIVYVASYDLANGKLLWELAGGGDIPLPAPIVAHGLAFFTSAHGKYRPLRAVRLTARGNVTPPEMEATWTRMADVGFRF